MCSTNLNKAHGAQSVGQGSPQERPGPGPDAAVAVHVAVLQSPSGLAQRAVAGGVLGVTWSVSGLDAGRWPFKKSHLKGWNFGRLACHYVGMMVHTCVLRVDSLRSTCLQHIVPDAMVQLMQWPSLAHASFNARSIFQSQTHPELTNTTWFQKINTY